MINPWGQRVSRRPRSCYRVPPAPLSLSLSLSLILTMTGKCAGVAVQLSATLSGGSLSINSACRATLDTSGAALAC
jgi:hypothetical protein